MSFAAMETPEAVEDRFKGDKLVTISVEDNGIETFVVQKAVLCSVSQYFRKALSGKFKESRQLTLNLPGSTNQSVRLFIYWLAKHELPDSLSEAHLTNGDHNHEDKDWRDYMGSKQAELVHLWVFADRDLIPKLQNEAADDLLVLLELQHVHEKAVRAVFTQAPQDSPLQELVVRSFLHLHGYDLLHNWVGNVSYDEEALSVLGSIPGFMARCFVEMLRQTCGAFPCTCTAECYRIKECDYARYEVEE